MKTNRIDLMNPVAVVVTGFILLVAVSRKQCDETNHRTSAALSHNRVRRSLLDLPEHRLRSSATSAVDNSHDNNRNWRRKMDEAEDAEEKRQANGNKNNAPSTENAGDSGSDDWPGEVERRLKEGNQTTSPEMSTAVLIGSKDFAVITGNEVEYYQFAPTGKLIRSPNTTKVEDNEMAFPSNLTASVPVPDVKTGDTFMFRFRKFCKRRLLGESDTEEFLEDDDRQFESESRCMWINNRFLFGCQSSKKKPQIFDQFCVDPFVTGAFWLNKKLHILSGKWLFIFDGVNDGEALFGDMIDGGIDSSTKWKDFEWRPTMTVLGIQNKLIVLENDTMSRWDGNGYKEVDKEPLGSEETVKAELDDNSDVNVNVIIKLSRTNFARVNNDLVQKFKKQSMGWKFEDRNMTLEEAADEINENLPSGLTGRLDELPKGAVIYFKTKTWCKPTSLKNGKNCVFKENTELFRCQKIFNDYFDQKNQTDGMQEFCRNPNVTGAVNAVNSVKGQLFIFRASLFWVFNTDNVNIIGKLFSGPHQAEFTWPGWRKDNDGFFYNAGKFIMFYQDRWWSWGGNNEEVSGKPLDEGEHNESTENEKMVIKNESEEESSEPKNDAQSKDNRKDFKNQERQRESCRKRGPPTDVQALRELCKDLNIADGDITTKGDIYLFREESYFKCKLFEDQLFVVGFGMSTDILPKFNSFPDAVMIVQEGIRRGYLFEFNGGFYSSWRPNFTPHIGFKAWWGQPEPSRKFGAVFHNGDIINPMAFGLDRHNVHYYSTVTNAIVFREKRELAKSEELFPDDVTAAWRINDELVFFFRADEYCTRNLTCQDEETRCCERWYPASELFGCEHNYSDNGTVLAMGDQADD